MCDYSILTSKTRPAAVGDKLITTLFGSTHGFSAINDAETAVCVMPGTELAFESPVERWAPSVGCYRKEVISPDLVARFRQVDKDQLTTHHDALEFPDGTLVKLNELAPDQCATILQMPAAPKTDAETKEQARLEVVA